MTHLILWTCALVLVLYVAYSDAKVHCDCSTVISKQQAGCLAGTRPDICNCRQVRDSGYEKLIRGWYSKKYS